VAHPLLIFQHSLEMDQGAPVMKNDKTLEISLGDLLTEITEEALRFARNEEEANIAVANIVTDLLRNSGPISKCWH
jgi:hypothetical protein